MFHRRRTGRPPPMAEAGDDAPVELEVRVQPGAEDAALSELLEVGAAGSVVGRGELRVRPVGPLRPVLAVESALAFYAVRRLDGVELRGVDAEALLRAALGLAGVVASLQRGKLRSFRVTGAPELGAEQKLVNILSQRLGARLAIPPALVQPELILIVRPAATGGGFELAARLPKAGERPRAPVARPDAPRGRASFRPRRSGQR